LKGVVRRVLADAARDGLPGEHHFYVSFRTDSSGVRLSPRLREKYPRDMTIVVQHQYEGLSVTDHAFEVGLSFSGVAERLRVPFDALTGFFDPSVQFGLKFEQTEAGEEAEPAEPPGPAVEPIPIAPRKSGVPALKGPASKSPSRKSEAAEKAPEPAPAKRPPEKKDGETPGAEVVSLDSFRKKS
jgi:hypothetical protein